ncbi:hypothetical protein ZIOFF_017560 [Zingiber officinale]|uniref:DDE Tnp4 domain-containing protein n=1 Tax=Zingiber officinale TaxID=94328 RepID=A0A8J5H756_ZINOF|nr:hypothetical protein ZIOFF_017560 [Zingiber officinale]
MEKILQESRTQEAHDTWADLGEDWRGLTPSPRFVGERAKESQWHEKFNVLREKFDIQKPEDRNRSGRSSLQLRLSLFATSPQQSAVSTLFHRPPFVFYRPLSVGSPPTSLTPAGPPPADCNNHPLEPIAADSIDWRWKWFKMGHTLKLRVPAEDKPRYRTRKGEIATNVLIVCSQDMQFTYVLSGWEGSATDSRVNMTSNPSGEYYNPKRPVKNKHQWSTIEDVALIEALMQLHNIGDLRNKNEKGFRPGHGLKLQQMLESLVYYEELSVIFGGDCASGKDAQGPADIVEELDKVAVENDESIGVDGDYAPYAQDFIFGSNVENSKPERRKTESTKDLSRVIREATTILGEELNNASNRLSKALEYDEGAEKRMKVNEVLTKLPGLSMLERHKAIRKIGCDRETTDIFFTIPDDEKEAFVKALLSGDI